MIEAEAFSWARVAGRPTDLPGPPGRRTLRKSSTGHSTASFFSRSGPGGLCPLREKAGLKLVLMMGKRHKTRSVRRRDGLYLVVLRAV